MQVVQHIDADQAQLIDQTYHGPQGVGPVIDRFMQHMRTALDHASRKSLQLPRAVDELVASTDWVLTALNTAATAFDQVTRQKETQRMKELTDIMADIQSVAREANVIAFNAQVIAARAGEHGRGFAVVTAVRHHPKN